MLDQNIVREATRLTRAGQLVKATELLQRMLRGERVSKPSGSAADVAAPRLEPPTIDVKANVVEEKESRKSTKATSVEWRKRNAPLDGMREFSGLGLRGSMKRTPPCTRDIAPEGTRFIAGTFRNAAGSRSYKLFIPSCSRGRRLPLVVMLHGCTQSPDDFAPGTRMNFLAEELNCFVVYPDQPREATRRNAGTGFARATSSGVAANLR